MGTPRRAQTSGDARRSKARHLAWRWGIGPSAIRGGHSHVGGLGAGIGRPGAPPFLTGMTSLCDRLSFQSQRFVAFFGGGGPRPKHKSV